ncbi:MAG: class I SAM-dependent methyltransferase [Pseudomonadota bacterium]
MLGIGFPGPALSICEEAALSVAAMPTTQGGQRWPERQPSRAAVVREDELPFDDNSFDRVVLMHALESSPHAHRLLREVWRVLADGGKLIVIVPNRRGLWCWSDRTPFGYGQPFTERQLQSMLISWLFDPHQTAHALFFPPVLASFWERLAVPTERIGIRYLRHLSGVLITEAEKSVFIGKPIFSPLPARRRRYIAVPEPALQISANDDKIEKHFGANSPPRTSP